MVAPPRVRKERLDAVVENSGKKRAAEVHRRERELDEGLVAPLRRLEGTGVVSHTPVPAWSTRVMGDDEWREVDALDTRVDWAANPGRGGPVEPCTKRRRVHRCKSSRLSELYDNAGLQCARHWDGERWVASWVNLGRVRNVSYEDMDLTGVT